MTNSLNGRAVCFALSLGVNPEAHARKYCVCKSVLCGGVLFTSCETKDGRGTVCNAAVCKERAGSSNNEGSRCYRKVLNVE